MIVDEKKRRIEASFFDDLLKDAGKSLFRGMAERLEAGARDMVGWSLHRIAMGEIRAHEGRRAARHGVSLPGSGGGSAVRA